LKLQLPLFGKKAVAKVEEPPLKSLQNVTFSVDQLDKSWLFTVTALKWETSKSSNANGSVKFSWVIVNCPTAVITYCFLVIYCVRSIASNTGSSGIVLPLSSFLQDRLVLHYLINRFLKG